MFQRAERVSAKALRQEAFSGNEAGESGPGGTRMETLGEVQEGARVLGNSVARILIAIKIPLEVFNRHIDLLSNSL